MVLLPFSNIIVDEFSSCRKNPNVKYIHFLTHMHSDHHTGMVDNWNYGKIYCSQVTGSLLNNKFSGVTEAIVSLDLHQKHTIKLGDKLNIQVTLLEANHCPGAVMFLFEGYFGTYLYTGDIRFDKNIFEKYNDLYPEYSIGDEFIKCSKKIDILFLDNTFCDPQFTFPPKAQVMKQIKQFVFQCKAQKKRVYIALDSLGKQQILLDLAMTFSNYVVVSNSKYYTIVHSRLNHHLFTMRPHEGWIEVISKKQMKSRLAKEPNAVGIIPTGWCNKSFTSKDGRVHMFPYSLHSNFEELNTFMKSLNVAQVMPIVRNFESSKKVKDDYGDVVSEDHIYRLSQLSQRGLPQLEKKYTTKKHSKEYLELLNNSKYFKEIEKQYTKQQSEYSRQLEQNKKFRQAEDIESTLRIQDQMRNRKTTRKHSESASSLNKKDETDYQQMKIDLEKRKQQKILELKQKGIQIKPTQQYHEEVRESANEKKKQAKKFEETKRNERKNQILEKERARNSESQQSRSKSNSVSRQLQHKDSHSVQRKTKKVDRFCETSSNNIKSKKTIKADKKYRVTETIVISSTGEQESSSENSKQCEQEHSASKKISQIQAQIIFANSRIQDQSRYVREKQMQSYVRLALEKHNSKKREQIRKHLKERISEMEEDKEEQDYQREEEEKQMLRSRLLREQQRQQQQQVQRHQTEQNAKSHRKSYKSCEWEEFFDN